MSLLSEHRGVITKFFLSGDLSAFIQTNNDLILCSFHCINRQRLILMQFNRCSCILLWSGVKEFINTSWFLFFFLFYIKMCSVVRDRISRSWQWDKQIWFEKINKILCRNWWLFFKPGLKTVLFTRQFILNTVLFTTVFSTKIENKLISFNVISFSSISKF